MSQELSTSIYRKYNLDLRDLTDAELERHFSDNNHERRIYGLTESTTDFISMKWLRGNGIEIGAGSKPIPLYGNATVEMDDVDTTLAYGGVTTGASVSLDDPHMQDKLGRRFDFAVASHVLEHIDSFYRGIDNLLSITRRGGIAYIVLPDVNFLYDKDWMPKFDLLHHEREFIEPLEYAKMHDGFFISGTEKTGLADIVHAHISNEFKHAVACKDIPQHLRFIYHKHNYDFENWLELIMASKSKITQKFRLLESRYGYERSDCHFVLEVI